MAESGLHLLPKNLCDITPSRKCEHPITKCEHPSTKSHHPSTLARSTPPGFSASPTSTARLQMKKNKKTKTTKGWEQMSFSRIRESPRLLTSPCAATLRCFNLKIEYVDFSPGVVPLQQQDTHHGSPGICSKHWAALPPSMKWMFACESAFSE